MIAAPKMTVADNFDVCRVGFGALRLISPSLWGPPTDRSVSVDLLRAVVDLGMNFIDTADVYGPNVSEQIVAEALYPYDQELVVTTKGGRTLHEKGVWGTDGHPRNLKLACERSLRRLRLDCIDIYQLHAVDPLIPFEDSIGALVELREAGKIAHIGLSNVTAKQIELATTLTTIVSVQNKYNIVDRQFDDVVDLCLKNAITFVPWQPVAKVIDLEQMPLIAQIARAKQVTPAQIALAWLLHHAPNILPIPGTTNLNHASENLASGQIELTKDEMRQLSSLPEAESSSDDDK